MNLKNIILFIVIIFSGYFVYNKYMYNQKDALVKTLKTKKSKSIVIRKSHEKKVKNDVSSNELYLKLKEPSLSELEDNWSDWYGCSNEDVELDLVAKCKYSFLSAHSYDEAVWMRNNGYPTIEMLNMIKDKSNFQNLKDLIKEGYAPAMIVASINSREEGRIKEAARLASMAASMSDKSKTFPHLLDAEAKLLLGGDMKIAAVTKFYVAGLLGDTLAEARASSLAPDIYFSNTAMKTAYSYLTKVFGTPIPNDPRPDGG